MFVVLFAGILWRWELQHGGSTTHHMEKLVQPRSLPLRFMKQRPNWLWDLLRGRVRPGNRNHKHQVLKICYINTCGHQNPRTHSKLFYNYAEKTRTAMVVGDVIALLSVPIPHSKFQSYIYIHLFTKHSSTLVPTIPGQEILAGYTEIISDGKDSTSAASCVGSEMHSRGSWFPSRTKPILNYGCTKPFTIAIA